MRNKIETLPARESHHPLLMRDAALRGVADIRVLTVLATLETILSVSVIETDGVWACPLGRLGGPNPRGDRDLALVGAGDGHSRPETGKEGVATARGS